MQRGSTVRKLNFRTFYATNFSKKISLAKISRYMIHFMSYVSFFYVVHVCACVSRCTYVNVCDVLYNEATGWLCAYLCPDMVLQSGTLDRRAYKGKVPLRNSAPGGSCDAGSDVCMYMASCSYTEAAGEAVQRLKNGAAKKLKLSCEGLSLPLTHTYARTHVCMHV